MEAVRPHLKVLYNGVNISEDISRHLVSFNYSDHLDEADTVDITLEDSDLLWQGSWYPSKGATIVAEIGIQGGAILPCGTFEIDEIEMSGPPDVITIRGIAAGFSKGKKRSQKSHVHENKTLGEIVRTIAGNAGLSVQGKIADVRINRRVQKKERDMRFLRRLALDYGYTFNIRDKVLTFMPIAELEARPSSLSIDKTDLINYSLRDKSTGTYAAASITFHNPETGETIKHVETGGGVPDTDDVMEIKVTAETKAQAIEITKAALHRANKLQQSGNITMPGSPLIVAGNVTELTGLGTLSGNYTIKTSAHTVGLSEGWLVDAEVYKVGFIEESKHKPKKGKKSKAKGYDGPEGDGDLSMF